MTQLKIRDLSVGDWVCYDRGTDAVQIMGIYVRNNQECVVMSDSYFPDGVIGFVEHIKPIPITPEILEKNGSKKTEFVKDSGYEFYQSDDFYASRVEGSKWWTIIVCNECREVVQCYVQHVHQMQHALRLSGVEKEIIL